MKRVAFHSLGCKVNSYETNSMEASLIEQGYEVVPFNEFADIYVVNTCVVTSIADKKSRQILRRSRNINSNALIIACGCYVNKDANYLIENGLCDIVIGNNDKNSLIEHIAQWEKNNECISISNIHKDSTKYENMKYSLSNDKTRAFIKIQDGCDMKCAYCIIPSVRGKSRSRDIDDIIRETTFLANNDFKEVVLTGIHLSSYFVNNKRLIDVIDEIQKIEGIQRIRIGSIEPNVINDNFLSRLKNNDKFCHHFHISMQSGSDSVLKAMNRHYCANDIRSCIDLIRKYYPIAGISADIIAGYPGETDYNHKETISLLKEINLSDVHAFPYSRRKGTVADTLENQVTKAVKESRVKELIEIVKSTSLAYKNSLINREVEVLLQDYISKNGKTFLYGLSKEYMTVYTLKDHHKGEIITDLIRNVDQDGILYI